MSAKYDKTYESFFKKYKYNNVKYYDTIFDKKENLATKFAE